jgi:hypothetical protein
MQLPEIMAQGNVMTKPLGIFARTTCQPTNQPSSINQPTKVHSDQPHQPTDRVIVIQSTTFDELRYNFEPSPTQHSTPYFAPEYSKAQSADIVARHSSRAAKNKVTTKMALRLLSMRGVVATRGLLVGPSPASAQPLLFRSSRLIPCGPRPAFGARRAFSDKVSCRSCLLLLLLLAHLSHGSMTAPIGSCTWLHVGQKNVCNPDGTLPEMQCHGEL